MSAPTNDQKVAASTSDGDAFVAPHPSVAVWLAKTQNELSPVEKRRLSLQDALLKLAETRGYETGGLDGDFSHAWLVVKGERVEWRLRERWCSRNIPLTKKELKRETSGKTWKQIMVPSGCLVLSIKADHSPEKDIYEKPKRPFETRIEQFLSRFEALAAYAIEQKEYWADWERRRAQKLERRRQKERLQEIEYERWSKLRRMAAEWEETERLRNFVDAVSRRLKKLKNRPRRADLWIEWAHRRIDALDPFTSNPRFIFETAVQKPRRRVLSEYEALFGEPDPDEDED